MSDMEYGREPAPTAPAPPQSNGAAIASIITGIIALLLSWIPGINLLAIVLAIVAIVTGIIGLRNANVPGTTGKGLAITGLITGILALLLSILVYVGLAQVFNNPEVQEGIRDLQSELEQMTEG